MEQHRATQKYPKILKAGWTDNVVGVSKPFFHLFALHLLRNYAQLLHQIGFTLVCFEVSRDCVVGEDSAQDGLIALLLWFAHNHNLYYLDPRCI